MKLHALALLLVVPAAQAQLYKCVDADGKTRYSDKPFTDCKTRKTIATPPPSDRRQAASPTKGAPASEAKRPPPPLSALKKVPPPGRGGAPMPLSQSQQQQPQQAADAAPTEHDKKYAIAHCRELKEEEAWLLGKRGAKLENRDARLGQVRQALAGCP